MIQMTLSQLRSRLQRLARRRQALLAGLRLPPKGLPGSLAPSHRRCGSAGCHCHQGQGHRSWTLTFMVDGQKRVEHIPTELLDTVRARVKSGNAYKRAVAELMALNAQLLLLGRRARQQQAAAGQRKAGR
jgi:hypothetical protein